MKRRSSESPREGAENHRREVIQDDDNDTTDAIRRHLKQRERPTRPCRHEEEGGSCCYARGDREWIPAGKAVNRLSTIIPMRFYFCHSNFTWYYTLHFLLPFPPFQQMEIVDEEAAIRHVKELEAEEPLLQENPRRFVMFPIEHPDIWQFYKKAEGNTFNVVLLVTNYFVALLYSLCKFWRLVNIAGRG